MRLLEPLPIASATASNRLLFGPHVTNLGNDDRELTDRHTAYYERRAKGGCGLIVVEGASVHPSDWPYERAPRADRCPAGWRSIADACHQHGALVVASLDHAGGQGSSAYSQLPLWAPSRVPEINAREVPKWMEAADIDAVIDGFATAAAAAMAAGVDGVEINAGQHSLVRQFMSALTNQRDDEWGQDRLLLARRVIAAVRSASGPGVVGLRLSCDELAPWAGITPDMAPAIAAELAAGGVDYLVVTRGSIYSAEKTRPDFHEPTGFNIDVCRAVREAVRAAGHDLPVYLQGSVVDVGQAEWSIGGYEDAALADGVEMTRAQIADPDLGAKLAQGLPGEVRPCTRCNQTCQVRDACNPIITCVGEPTSGRETEDPDWYSPATSPQQVIVIGGGPAGLETARVAAVRGHAVTIIERDDDLGGLARVAGPHAPLVEWYRREHARLGTTIRLGTSAEDVLGGPGAENAISAGAVVVQCTGSVAGRREYDVADDAIPIFDIADLRRSAVDLPSAGTIALFDPIGGPIAVALAEELGDRAVLITHDQIAGNELARTGDLAPANTRLAQGKSRIERRAILRRVTSDGAELEDRFNGERRTLPCAALVDCGFRLPDAPLPNADHVAGDAVAPRTMHEAVLEGRRVGHAI